MILDSDPEIADLIQSKVESFGLEAFSYSCQENALSDYEVIYPEVIIMDSEYARSQGIAFLNRLSKNIASNEMMPTIKLVDGKNHEQWHKYTFDMGAQTFDNQFYDFASLQSALSDYLPSDEEELGLHF